MPETLEIPMEIEEMFAKLYSYLEDRFAKIDARFDAIELRLDKIENRLDKVENRLDNVEQHLNYHTTWLNRIEKNMVTKTQFNSLISILQHKEILTEFEAAHVLGSA